LGLGCQKEEPSSICQKKKRGCPQKNPWEKIKNQRSPCGEREKKKKKKKKGKIVGGIVSNSKKEGNNEEWQENIGGGGGGGGGLRGKKKRRKGKVQQWKDSLAKVEVLKPANQQRAWELKKKRKKGGGIGKKGGQYAKQEKNAPTRRERTGQKGTLPG